MNNSTNVWGMNAVKNLGIFAAAVFALILAACGGGADDVTPTAASGAASAAIAQATSPPASQATHTPVATDTPAPTNTPVPTNTPAPTHTPVATTTPAPTNTAVPTNTPAPTHTPVATDTPEPTVTPVPTNTPAPTRTPEPTNTPAPTHTPEPTPTYTPMPTNTPTVEELIEIIKGRHRDNPVPFRDKTDLVDSDGLVLHITKVLQGDAAVTFLDEANNPDVPPPPGHKFTLIRITVENAGAQPVAYPAYRRLLLVGETADIASRYTNAGVAGERDDCGNLGENFHESQTITPGATHAGYVCFAARTEDAGKLLLVDNGGSADMSDDWRYFALR